MVTPALCSPTLAFKLFTTTLDEKLPLVPLVDVIYAVVADTVAIFAIVLFKLVMVEFKKSTVLPPAPADKNADTLLKLLSILLNASRILSPVPSLGLVPVLTAITPVVGFQKAIAIILYIAYLADLAKGQF